jgi:hypothetical protein
LKEEVDKTATVQPAGIGLDFAALPDHSPPDFDWEGA